jgi:hypothetical protein
VHFVTRNIVKSPKWNSNLKEMLQFREEKQTNIT